MTAARLKQYRALHREIEVLNRAIAELDAQGPSTVSDTVTSAAEWPYSKHSVRIDGPDWEGYSQERKRAVQLREAAKVRAEAELADIEEFMAEIEDSELRQLFRMRYAEGMTWIQIAFRIGRHDEQYPRKKVNSFLKSTKSTVS